MLPLGGSFGEYSLNDLEEQPGSKGRTIFTFSDLVETFIQRHLQMTHTHAIWGSVSCSRTGIEPQTL